MRRALGRLAVAAATLSAAPAALADTTQSANWAGYAIHRSGVHFERVTATWQQPTAACQSDTPTYSSVWVGLGGYSINSQALEQIGSEVDCSPTGRIESSVWYELVPAASHTIHMTVAPGDVLRAIVFVSGHRVHLDLRDETRHTTFSRNLHSAYIDVTSADWIVEAPSECTSNTNCQTLALANFGSATFSDARATTVGGHIGSISDRRWKATKIRLTAGQRRFIGTAAAASASPSALTANGTSFTVTYRDASSGGVSSEVVVEARRAPAEQALHPGGVRHGLRRTS
jgi:hypothetical protein